MIVSLSMLRRILSDVVSGKLTRDEVDRWACARIQEFEGDTLEYDPPEDEAKIWDVLTFLHGIDILDGESFLHSDEEILVRLTEI